MFDRDIRRLTRMGLSVLDSRELRVRGRTTGEWRCVPVNLLTVGDDRYLVAPRGTTQWVRNLRTACTGELHVGRRADRFAAIELADDEKPAVLREYPRQWAFEAGAFFDGVGASATDDQLREIAPQHPVLRVVAV